MSKGVDSTHERAGPFIISYSRLSNDSGNVDVTTIEVVEVAVKSKLQYTGLQHALIATNSVILVLYNTMGCRKSATELREPFRGKI
jgi:hypothetical protein